MTCQTRTKFSLNPNLNNEYQRSLGSIYNKCSGMHVGYNSETSQIIFVLSDFATFLGVSSICISDELSVRIYFGVFISGGLNSKYL